MTNTMKTEAKAFQKRRGFNLFEFFWAKGYDEVEPDHTISKDDCGMIRDLGFDLIRLPMDYRLWIDSDWRMTGRVRVDDMLKFKESVLEEIDRSIEIAQACGLHICLNFHRGPGYCIGSRELEPFVLWSDYHAEEIFVKHWEFFAKRYQGIPSSVLSFNLLNEPTAPSDKPEGYMKYEDHTRVMTHTIKAIRAISPDRLIILDGYRYGQAVIKEITDLDVVQSCRGYHPHEISHYRTAWVDKESSFPPPAWPSVKEDGTLICDRAGLEKYYAPWGEWVRQGGAAHCGEAGCFINTPHDVFMAWISDVLDILSSHGMGYALWGFRGGMGVLDTDRDDVEYEDWHGHKLDRAFLDLLQRH